MLSRFSRSKAARMLAISPGRLRYWERIGLVQPSFRERNRNFYSFQDLVELKRVRELSGNGLNGRVIKKNLDSLKTRFSTGTGPLNASLLVSAGRIMVRYREEWVDCCSGQFLLNFERSRSLCGPTDAPREIRESSKTARRWFEEGLRLDGSSQTYDRAISAYQQALTIDPEFSDAHLNLGTVYYNQNRYEESLQCFLRVLEQKPGDARACFNLGNVSDELGRVEEAVTWYERSREADPNFSDVYYNLAATCEKLGLWNKALRHWNDYLQFDSSSSHAAVARKRIKLLQSERLHS